MVSLQLNAKKQFKTGTGFNKKVVKDDPHMIHGNIDLSDAVLQRKTTKS